MTTLSVVTMFVEHMLSKGTSFEVYDVLSIEIFLIEHTNTYCHYV